MTMMPCHFGVITEPRYASGGLAHAAQRVNAAGRNGDSVVVHLSPEEFGWLRQNWGEPTRNPKTGLPDGFKKGTTPANFITNVGGWGCKHELMPVSDAVVPESLKKKFQK